MSNHVIKCFSKLICNLLDLQFLPVDLVLYIVDSLVQLRYIHLSILIPIGVKLKDMLKKISIASQHAKVHHQ